MKFNTRRSVDKMDREEPFTMKAMSPYFTSCPSRMKTSISRFGDAEFQKKCLGKMKDVAEDGRTVIFVSHDIGVLVLESFGISP